MNGGAVDYSGILDQEQEETCVKIRDNLDSLRGLIRRSKDRGLKAIALEEIDNLETTAKACFGLPFHLPWGHCFENRV